MLPLGLAKVCYIIFRYIRFRYIRFLLLVISDSVISVSLFCYIRFRYIRFLEICYSRFRYINFRYIKFPIPVKVTKNTMAGEAKYGVATVAELSRAPVPLLHCMSIFA